MYARGDPISIQPFPLSDFTMLSTPLLPDSFSFSYVIILLVLTAVIGVISRRNRKARLPPGPPPLPFIGNILDVPKSMSAKEYDRLCQTYGKSRALSREVASPPLICSNALGEIVHLDALGQHIIVLGSQEAISEILEKRSAKSSNRPPSAMSDL